jgi:hypothetical protein
MAGFLGVASAKFIMSPTGLACSIVFSIVLRHRTARVERALRAVNEAIADRLSFLSQEDLALRLLKERGQTRSFLQSLATDIAMQIGQSLGGNIAVALRDGMSPLIERLQSQSRESFGTMVETLSQQIAGDVGCVLATRARGSRWPPSG